MSDRQVLVTAPPVDPAGPFRAAIVLARLAARGSLTAAECLPLLLAAAAQAAPQRDPSGLRMRLIHHFTDTAEEAALQAESARAHAATAIRAAMRRGMAQNAPAASLRARARAAGHPALSAAESDSIAAGILAASLRRSV